MALFLSDYSKVTRYLFFLLCIPMSLNALNGKLLFLLSIGNARVSFGFCMKRNETWWTRLNRVFMIRGILKSSQIIHAIDYSLTCKPSTLNCYFQLYQLWSLGLSQIFTFLLPPWDSWFILKPSCRISSPGSTLWSFRLTWGSRRISGGRGLKSNGSPDMTL